MSRTLKPTRTFHGVEILRNEGERGGIPRQNKPWANRKDIILGMWPAFSKRGGV